MKLVELLPVLCGVPKVGLSAFRVDSRKPGGHFVDRDLHPDRIEPEVRIQRAVVVPFVAVLVLFMLVVAVLVLFMLVMAVLVLIVLVMAVLVLFMLVVAVLVLFVLVMAVLVLFMLVVAVLVLFMLVVAVLVLIVLVMAFMRCAPRVDESDVRQARRRAPDFPTPPRSPSLQGGLP